MLRTTLANFVKARNLLGLVPKANYIRGYWPEPITQQTLDEFLQDINYFENPTELVNIGLEFKDNTPTKEEALKVKQHDELKALQVDKVLDMLSHDAKVPDLNYSDITLRGKPVINLALSFGIFRDLFGNYVPNRDYIKFTREQAERLDLLVPHYWITDQPFARVERNPKKLDQTYYFNPVVGVSAKFINKSQLSNSQQDDDLYAHTSYYGNIIPPSEASTKPSITLDGSLLDPENPSNTIPEDQYDNWTAGQIKLVNFREKLNKLYSVVLVNLDYLHENAVNLHWMIANIRSNEKANDGAASFDELCDYLPVHGIRGFGYSRYVFLVFQHDSTVNIDSARIEGFSLESRKFDVKAFIDKHKDVNMIPVGLSWFQTSWDSSSNAVFHSYLNVKAPTYDHVQTKLESKDSDPYPGRVPFQVFLDHKRDQKEINEQVLLERLKTVDPHDYRDQYVPPRVPPTVFEDDEKDLPSWMKVVMFKKKNKIGYWRGLRPASAILPLDNNADLDYPIRPLASSKKNPPESPNQYPGKIIYKAHKDMPTSKPVNEHQSAFIQDDHKNHLDKVMRVLNEFETNTKIDKK